MLMKSNSWDSAKFAKQNTPFSFFELRFKSEMDKQREYQLFEEGDSNPEREEANTSSLLDAEGVSAKVALDVINERKELVVQLNEDDLQESSDDNEILDKRIWSRLLDDSITKLSPLTENKPKRDITNKPLFPVNGREQRRNTPNAAYVIKPPAQTFSIKIPPMNHHINGYDMKQKPASASAAIYANPSPFAQSPFGYNLHHMHGHQQSPFSAQFDFSVGGAEDDGCDGEEDMLYQRPRNNGHFVSNPLGGARFAPHPSVDLVSRSYHNGNAQGLQSQHQFNNHQRQHSSHLKFAAMSLSNQSQHGSAATQSVYEVEFKRGRTAVFVTDVPHAEFTHGEFVFVEADRGEHMGQICRVFYLPTAEINTHGDSISGKILRRATMKDIQKLTQKYKEESKSVLVCQQKVKEYGLEMEIVDAEFQFDRKKLTFFYRSNARVDFRELIRDMYKVYRCRVWMDKIDDDEISLLQAHSLSL